MQAVVFEQAGRADDVLVVREMPSPVIERDQVLIQVAARPIQPADFLFIEGRYRVKPIFPQVAGLEGVGTLVACGTDMVGLKPGVRVAFRSPGAWAEYAVAPISRVYPVPSGVSDSVASQFALNPLTAWGLLAECNLSKGSRVLITAGRSIVARILSKLAELSGFIPFLLVREDSAYAVLEGNSRQIVAKKASVAEVLQEVTKNGLFHAVLDCVGGSNSLALIDSLEPRGRLISYGVLDDNDITLRAARIIYKNMIWQGFGVDGWLNNARQDQLEDAQRQLWRMLSEFPDLLPVIASFSLSQVKQAIGTVRETRFPGKVLLVG